MISFIDNLSMEKRLISYKYENEMERFMNGTMQSNIHKNTSFNFELYCIFCTVGKFGNRIPATTKLSKNQQNI